MIEALIVSTVNVGYLNILKKKHSYLIKLPLFCIARLFHDLMKVFDKLKNPLFVGNIHPLR